jgi:hypothetical protein
MTAIPLSRDGGNGWFSGTMARRTVTVTFLLPGTVLSLQNDRQRKVLLATTFLCREKDLAWSSWGPLSSPAPHFCAETSCYAHDSLSAFEGWG